MSLALVMAYLAPGAALELALHMQRASLRPVALLVAYIGGALLIVFPISYLLLPCLLRRSRLAGAAERIRDASLYALQPVMAFLPAWHVAAYFGANEVARGLLAAGGTAVLMLLTDPIFRSLGYGFFEE